MISKEPLLGTKGRENPAANTVCSALAAVPEKGRGNTTNLSRGRKQLRAPNLQRSLQTFQRQLERRHLPAAEVMIPQCRSLPSSPPLIPAPLTVHCFKNLGRREKLPQSPHSVRRDRGASAAQKELPAGSKDPAALPGASAGDGQASTSTEQRSSRRTYTRAHEQCSPRLRQCEAFSSSKKKKKSELQAPSASRGRKRRTKAPTSSNQRAQVLPRSRPSRPHAQARLQ